MAGHCLARCKAEVQAQAECKTPRLSAFFVGAVDGRSETLVRQTIENDLGVLIEVATGLGQSALATAELASHVVEESKEEIRLADSPRKADLEACVSDAWEGAIAAATRLRESVAASTHVLEGISPMSTWRR
jgi:hypothetical protein